MSHRESEFEVYGPQLVAIRRANQHGSRVFDAHQNKYGILTIDFCIVKMLSWEYHTTRHNIGKLGVKHLALIPDTSVYGTRLIGIPVDRSDHPIRNAPQLDLRLKVQTQDVDPSLPPRVLDVVPDWLARETKHGLLAKFDSPLDLLERVESVPPRTLLPN